MNEYHCRICNSASHQVILDYGEVALAGALLESMEAASSEEVYPLTLVFCDDCSHVQIREIVDPELLFSNYAWETGVGTSIFTYCKELADHVAQKVGLSEGDLVVEVASNDGTLLRQFLNAGLRVQGVDPAQRIAKKASDSGIPTLADFFNPAAAERVLSESGHANLIVARNVLAHVADLHGLVGGVAELLAEDGTAVIEFPYLGPLHEELQYDQVYHEHIGYHGLDSVRLLAEMHGMKLIDVERVALHGGSIRCYLANASDRRSPADAVADMLESEAPLLSFEAWGEFGDRVREQKRLLRIELEAAAEQGLTVVGYGASGKGQAMIQFCEFDDRLVQYIVDKAEIKHGMFTPGSHIPIHDPSYMKEAGADILLLFSWNLAAEIVDQERELAAGGMRFLHPIPIPHYM